MKKEMVGDMPGSVLGMFADLAHKLQHGAITPVEFELFLKHQNPFPVDSLDQLIESWRKFYWDQFRLEKDFAGLVIPELQPGFNRLLIMAEGMTPNRLFEKMKELMPALRYRDDLDVIVSDRRADHDYAVWVRDRIEADEELKNKSAEDLAKEDIPGITLSERLLYEIKFFKEAGGHLDIYNWTLCAGSRDSDDCVPYVSWYAGGVGVGWYVPWVAYGHLRARAVVSV